MLNPKVAELAEQMRQALPTPMTALPIDELRTMTSAMLVPSPVSVRDVREGLVEGAGGPIPIRVYRPDVGAAASAVLVWLHGGGYALGGLSMGDDLCRRLCVTAGVTVVNIDYRLAPEHPFPAGLEDCVAVYRWVRSGPAELRDCDTQAVAVAGDSAGGNLAMALALYCRDRGIPQPACQISYYGTADFMITNPEYAELPFLTGSDMHWFWDTYLPVADRDNPYAAPARTSNPGDLPPLLVITAENDPTRDGTEDYARRLRDAGVPVEMTRYAGVQHGFVSLTSLLPEAATALGQTVEFLRNHLQVDRP